MTAENFIDSNKENSQNAEDRQSTTQVTAREQLPTGELVPAEITNIFEFLSRNDKIVFKSQQIDDPELQRSEKIQIAAEIYARNRQTFLMRFGGYLENNHLKAFARLAVNTESTTLEQNSDENRTEMGLLLLEFQRKLQTRKRDVKNRRYAAMQQLIAKGEYFSEQEMMKRAPQLYQELVGQYLSEDEKKERDSYDVRNTTFSGILMHTMEQREMADMLMEVDKQNKRKENTTTQQAASMPQQERLVISAAVVQEEENEEDEEEDSITSDSNSSTHNQQTPPAEVSNNDEEVPASYRQQWGNFDNEQVACSTSLTVSHHKPAKSNVPMRIAATTECSYISAGERDLLRQEFVGIMHEQFLSGQDAEFDYSQVDENSQLDDLRQLNQDKEDAYFEATDDDDSDERPSFISEMMQNDCEDHSEYFDEESDDELDIYMSHLSKHHSLQ